MNMPTFIKSTAISYLFFAALYADCYNDDNCQTSVKAYDDHYAVPPPQYPSDSCAMIFFINAAYTFWQPYQQGMMLLSTEPKSPSTTPAASWVGTYMTPQSGFKVGAGINTFHDGWKAEAEYTWFYNHPAMRSTALDTTYINYTSTWDSEETISVRTIASQFTNLFQRVDLTLDRTFYAGNYLAFCPMGGLVGAWEEQNFNLEMTYNQSNPDSLANIRKIYQTMNWWGIGPYAALDTSYYCFDEWAIFFMAGGSINLAVHHTSKLETNAVTPTPAVYTRTKTKLPTVEPMLETAIGLRWDTFGMDWGLRVQIGWELQVWFNHNSFIETQVNYSNYGNYAMQGLTANFRANF